jgi:integrase
VPAFQRPTQTIPFEQFPPSFAAEVEDYLAWLAGERLFDDHQPPAACKSSTVELRRKQIQQLVSAAVHGGTEMVKLTSLQALVSRPIVEASIRYYLAKHDNQPTPYIRDLAKMLKRIAQHWVGVEEDELVWLRQLVRRLDTQAPGLTEKNRATLRQFDSPTNLQHLLEVPDALMGQAKTIANPYKAAHIYLWGLVIEILIFAPMRIGNLAALRPGSHLVRPEGTGGPILICLNAAETKNGRPHEYPLPKTTARKLDHYLKHHRPHLISDPDNPWLWPDRKGDHKSTVSMSERIKKLIYRETGLTVTPHQFRHLAAKLLLQARPGEFELARQVLGHRHVSTTVNFYAGMQSRESVALYDDIVSQRLRAPEGKDR